MHSENAKESALQVSWNVRIAKYVGLNPFRISVYKNTGGGPPCMTTAENRRTMRPATAGGPAQAGSMVASGTQLQEDGELHEARCSGDVDCSSLARSGRGRSGRAHGHRRRRDRGAGAGVSAWIPEPAGHGPAHGAGHVALPPASADRPGRVVSLLEARPRELARGAGVRGGIPGRRLFRQPGGDWDSLEAPARIVRTLPDGGRGALVAPLGKPAGRGQPRKFQRGQGQWLIRARAWAGFFFWPAASVS